MMPFPGGIEGLANGTLILSGALAAVYGAVVAHPPSLRRSVVKTASVALLALLAAIEGGPALLVLALALSAAGDAFLSRDGEPAFLGGLASFLLAHVAYVALFAIEGGGVEALAASPARIAAAAAMAGAVGFLLHRLLPSVPGGLRAPVLAYSAAILGMGIAALTLDSLAVIAGAVLFMASDALLAVGRFMFRPGSPHHSWQAPLVWALYYLGQLAIALGLLL